MAVNHELELKLELDPEVGERLAQSLAARFGPGTTRSLVSTYFDTPDLKLREHEVSLRIRRSGEQRMQTIKAGSVRHGGLFERREWECELDGEAPDLAAAAETPLGPLLKEGELREQLAPVLETRIERTLWDVGEGANGAAGEIELSLDRGLVEAEGRSVGVCELELELKSGSPKALLTLAKTLASEVEDAGVRLGVRSKSERGYRLIEKTDRRPAQAEPVELDPHQSTIEAFQAIGRACIRHFRLNEPLVVETGDPEAVHQGRVALRRLRSALSLFKPLFVDRELEPLKQRLKALAGALGDVRDLDVLLQSLTTRAAEAEDEALRALIEQVRREREETWRRALQTLAAPEARNLMLDLSLWIEAGDWTRSGRTRAARERPVRGFAAETLDHRRLKLRQAGAHLTRLDDDGRHQVRIEAKKLRYALDFLADVAVEKGEQKRQRAFVAALKTLQEDLGELNDKVQAQALTASLAQRFAERKGGVRNNAALIFAAGREAGRQACGMGEAIEAAAAAFHRFRQARPFWKA